MTEYHDLGGSIRANTPEETLYNIQPYIKAAGITRIANLTGLDNIGIPVYTCIRPNSKNLSTSQGKGITDSLAMCSAYMEGIEHFYAENVRAELCESLAYMEKNCLLHLPPYDFQSGFFYREIDKESKIDWSLGKNLINGEKIYIPSEVISFDLSQEDLSMGLYFKTTTGLAAGNNETEALCHSLYEIIERSCLYKFSQLPLKEKDILALDLDSIDYPFAIDILQKLTNSQVDVLIFDITNEFLVPAFHCIIADKNPLRGLGRYSGTGAHFGKGIALCRALTEAVQSRLGYIAGSRDDIVLQDYQKKWQKIPSLSGRPYSLIVDFQKLSLQQQLNKLITTFKDRAFNKIVSVFHTNSSDAICVVHTVVPNLNLTSSL